MATIWHLEFVENFIFIYFTIKKSADDLKGIVAQIDFFLFILKVANIRCFILIKCSEQEVRFKKYAIMS
jgi:hypothetical protein